MGVAAPEAPLIGGGDDRGDGSAALSCLPRRGSGCCWESGLGGRGWRDICRLLRGLGPAPLPPSCPLGLWHGVSGCGSTQLSPYKGGDEGWPPTSLGEEGRGIHWIPVGHLLHSAISRHGH